MAATCTEEDWDMFVRRLVDEKYEGCETITLVMDNLNTHGFASLYKAFIPE